MENDLVRQLDAAFGMRKSGDSPGALREFQNLERKSWHPKDVAALRLFQAMCLTDLEKLDEAQEKLSKVDKTILGLIEQIEYESEYARIERAEGKTKQALDRVCHAMRMVEEVRDKTKTEGMAEGLRSLQGILLAELNDCDSAIPILGQVSIEDDWWAEATIRLGDCMYRKKLFREAINCYSNLTSAAKKVDLIYREAAFRNIGFAYYDLGEFRNAIEYLTKVEHAYNENPHMKSELFGILASAYLNLGMTQEAARYGGFLRGTTSVH